VFHFCFSTAKLQVLRNLRRFQKTTARLLLLPLPL
jgi:hypothetical protein